MNANELADELDACANETMESLFKNKTKAGSLLWNIKVTDVEQRKQAATMLRQQQAENEALKKRELTDEEIHEEIYKYNAKGSATLFDLCKAILRKAQSK